MDTQLEMKPPIHIPLTPKSTQNLIFSLQSQIHCLQQDVERLKQLYNSNNHNNDENVNFKKPSENDKYDSNILQTPSSKSQPLIHPPPAPPPPPPAPLLPPVQSSGSLQSRYALSLRSSSKNKIKKSSPLSKSNVTINKLNE